jgi:beta-phosphoglucomutase-like phosphatase (HAD superfamily)
MAGPALKILGIGSEAPVVTRDQVRRAKPDPDLAAAERLGVEIAESLT